MAKTYIGIAPYGGRLIFSDLYLGSISDSEIIISNNRYYKKGHEFMTDKEFAMKELSDTKGVFHNWSLSKFSEQFTQIEAADNFDIVSLRIHVEQYIGR